eukprot:jgi/Picre1/32856/NNA_008185.t1
MYKRGYSLDAMKRIVTFGTLSAGGMEQPMMQDIMLTWMTLVYLTLDEIGLVKDAKLLLLLLCRKQMMMMKDHHRQKGWVCRLLMRNQGNLSGYAAEFQIGALGSSSDDDDSVIESPLHYAMTGFIRGMMDMPADPLDGSVSSREEDLRETAVRLLLSFKWCCLGYLSPAQSFVSTAAYCYVSGWTADEVYMVLRPEEFEQSGGLVKVARPPGGTNASATLFARWISSYI